MSRPQNRVSLLNRRKLYKRSILNLFVLPTLILMPLALISCTTTDVSTSSDGDRAVEMTWGKRVPASVAGDQKASTSDRLKYAAQLARDIQNSMAPLKNSPRKLLLTYFANELESGVQKMLESEELKPFLSQAAWVPTPPNVYSSQLNRLLYRPLLKFVAQEKAIADAQIYLNESRIVHSESEEVDAKLKEFARVFAAIDRDANSLLNILWLKPDDKEDLAWQARLGLVSFLANQVNRHLPTVISDPSKQWKITGVLSELEQLNGLNSSSEQKRLLNRILASSSWQNTKQSLTSVDLPDSGEVFGADQGFEAAMTVQLGFELVNHLTRDFNSIK